MASPQRENGYTSIANELLEVVVATPLPSRHKDLWWFVIRKTYGYNKKQDKISLSQFVRGTGIDRSGVCKIIKDLVAWRLLGKKGSIYAIIKDYSQWIPQKRKLSSGVADNRVVACTPHTKDNITKESIFTQKRKKQKTMFKEQDIITDEDDNILEDKETKLRAEAQAGFDRFIQEYKKGYIKEIGDNIPRYTIPTIRKSYKKVSELYTTEEMSELLPKFFATDFYKKTNWSPLTFLSERVLNHLTNL